MHIRQGTLADLPYCADVVAAAMLDDELTSYLAPYRKQYLACYYASCLLRLKKRFYAGEHLIVAMLDKNDKDFKGKEEIMGYAYYSNTLKEVQKLRPGSILGHDFERLAVAIEDNYSWYFNLDWSAVKSKVTDVVTSLAANPHFDGIPRYWELEGLSVSPSYQRRRVGAALLGWGFEKSRQYNVPFILRASLKGEKLYLHQGFRELGRFQIKGLEVTNAAMIWEPSQQASQ